MHKIEPSSLDWVRVLRRASELTSLSQETIELIEQRILKPISQSAPTLSVKPRNELGQVEAKIAAHTQPAEFAARQFLVLFDSSKVARAAKLLQRWEALFGPIYSKLPGSIRRALLTTSGEHRSLVSRFADLKELALEKNALLREESCLLSLGYLVKQNDKALAETIHSCGRSIAKHSFFLDYVIKRKFDFIEEVTKLLIRKERFSTARLFLSFVPNAERKKYNELLSFISVKEQAGRVQVPKGLSKWFGLSDLEKEEYLAGHFARLGDKSFDMAPLLKRLSSLRRWSGDSPKLKAQVLSRAAKNIHHIHQSKEGVRFLKNVINTLFDPFYAEFWESTRFSDNRTTVAKYFRMLGQMHLFLNTPSFRPREVISLYRAFDRDGSFQGLGTLYLPWHEWKKKLALALKAQSSRSTSSERKLLALSVCSPRKEITSSQLASFVGAFGFDPFAPIRKKPASRRRRLSSKELSDLSMQNSQATEHRDENWLIHGIQYFREPHGRQLFETTSKFKPCYPKMDLVKTSAWLMADFPPKTQKLLSFWLSDSNFRKLLHHIPANTAKAKLHPIFHGHIALQRVAFHLSTLGWFSRSDRMTSSHEQSFLQRGQEPGSVIADYLWSCFGFDLLLTPRRIKFYPTRWQWLLGSQKMEALVVKARSTAQRSSTSDLQESLQLFVLRFATLLMKHPTHILRCLAKSDQGACNLEMYTKLEAWMLSKNFLLFRSKTGQNVKTPIA